MFCMKAVAVVHCEQGAGLLHFAGSAASSRSHIPRVAATTVGLSRLVGLAARLPASRLRGSSRLRRAACLHRGCDARPTLNVVVVECRAGGESS